MDRREEMKRWISVVVQNAANESSKQIHSDIETFLGVSNQLAGVLSARSETLRRKIRQPTKCASKPTQAAPHRAQDKRMEAESERDSSKTGDRAQERSQGRLGGSEGAGQTHQLAQPQSKTQQTQPAQQNTARDIDQRSKQLAALKKSSAGARRA